MSETVNLKVWVFWSWLLYDPRLEEHTKNRKEIIESKVDELSSYFYSNLDFDVHIECLTYDKNKTYEENLKRGLSCDLAIYIHSNNIVDQYGNTVKPFLYQRIGKGICVAKNNFDKNHIPCLTWYSNDWKNTGFLSNFYVKYLASDEREWHNNFAHLTITRRVYPEDLKEWFEWRDLSRLKTFPVPSGYEGPKEEKMYKDIPTSEEGPVLFSPFLFKLITE